MSSLPSKLYVVSDSSNAVIRVFSSKTRMFRALLTWGEWRPFGVHTYEYFSEVVRFNPCSTWGCPAGNLTIRTVVPN